MFAVGSSSLGYSSTWQINRNSNSLTQSLVRLSTLKRINSGADDPAGLIAAEDLQSALASMDAALDQFDDSRAAIHVADSSMSSASGLLNDIRANVIAAASDTISDEQRAALQLEVDAAIEALDRLGGSTSFNGLSLLDGDSLTALIGADPAQTASVDLLDLSSSALGDGVGTLLDLRSGGSASLLSGDLESAMSILDGAASQVLSAQIEAATFEKYSLDASEAILQNAKINMSQALSQTLDADIAAESASFVQSQIRAKASILAAKAEQDSIRLNSRLLDYLA